MKNNQRQRRRAARLAWIAAHPRPSFKECRHLSASERAIAAPCPSPVKGGTLCALQPMRGLVGPDGTLWLFCPREDHCLWYRMSTEDQADAIAALLAANSRVA